MSDSEYWTLCLCIPAAAIAVVAAYSAGAGCYAITMNCFSIVEPDDAASRALFFAAQLAPFAAPSYAVVLLGAVHALRRFGAERTGPWLWLAPLACALLLHAACVAFAWAVLPERRITPSPAFDAAVLALGLAWIALAQRGLRALQVHRAQAARRRASSSWYARITSR